MKTYIAEITDSKGNQIATCEFQPIGFVNARRRAMDNAQAWKRREGYKGKVTIRTIYAGDK